MQTVSQFYSESPNNLLPNLSKQSGNFSFYPPQRMTLAERIYTLQPATAKEIKQDTGRSNDITLPKLHAANLFNVK